MVAVSFIGDARDPRARSGTPFGVVSGLEAIGAQVEVVRVALPPVLDKVASLVVAPRHLRRTAEGPIRGRIAQAYSAAHVAPPMAAVRSAVARRYSGLAVDGWVQLGAGYAVDVQVPRVVYDDMTVPQASRFAYRNWSALSAADVRRRVELQRRVYRTATTCCMTSSWAAQSAVEELGVDAADVQVVAAGTHEPGREVHRDWSTPRYLLVGFDFVRKNGPRVVEAFRGVRDRYPAAQLDVVGGHPALGEPGITGHGILRRDISEQRDQMRSLFDRATCFVMPSLYEPAGVVFTEAAAAGLPSIGGTVGGSRDFIGDGGLVVDPKDVGSIQEAMLRFADPAEAQRVGALAAARSGLFTWGAVAGRLLAGLGLQRPDGHPVDHLPYRPVPV